MLAGGGRRSSYDLRRARITGALEASAPCVITALSNSSQGAVHDLVTHVRHAASVDVLRPSAP
ncbi:hypothetical protein F4560_008699 [Saccharothrix ecbatanensis]|uniref:Uncharacterized protein n=1 Tax=Saccharothrix ecbatanensis TaxID=1105145 RepID=A0A7W9M668_9PSEU|nr:hypothetical protein [Saccharothrix ecbatanensis]